MFLSSKYIYRSLHNWILNKNDNCPRHRIFDTFFNYLGVIIISLIFIKEKEKEKEEEKDIDEESNEENQNLEKK